MRKIATNPASRGVASLGSRVLGAARGFFTASLVLAIALTGPLASEAVAQDRTGKAVTLRDQYVQEDASYAAMAAQKRLDSINFLKDLLAKGTAEGDQKAEMMLRLSDLYFQQGRYLYLLEMGEFDKQYDACFNTEGCNTETMVPNNTESRAWQEKSIKLYEQILRGYPRYARADEATFYLGSALKDVGRTEEAAEQFTNLVKKYSDSAFVPDAYIYIGEYYFDDNNAYKALLAFQKATAYPNSDMYGYALYKLAWCQYNVGEFDKAIETMKSVVAYSMADAAKDGRKVQLEEEALKDLVRFFADAGELDEAYEYFTKLGKKELIRSMLQRLASMYYEQGKIDQAITTYRRLISDNPQASDNPEYQHEIVMAYNKSGKRAEAIAEVDRYRQTYNKTSAWARSNASNQEAINKATETLEKDLRNLAVSYHDAAKKYGKGAEATATYELADRAYTMYLEDFSADKHAYEVRYAYAELLYKLQKYDQAYTQYMAVVALDPKGAHSMFCAESAIFAADEMVKREGGGNYAKPQAGVAKDPQPLTEWEQRLVDSCKQFADLFPNEGKVKNIIYRSAYLLYNKYRFTEAAAQFNAVIAMDPASKEAEQAAHLILDSFTVTSDWQNLKTNAKFYYDQPKLGSSTFKKEVYDIYERSSFKLIEVTYEKDKDHNKAADSFVAFYKEFPDSTVAAQALNNASVYYHQAGRPADALEARLILVEDPKFGDKTKYYYDQVGALGFDYETIASFDKAASYYERLFGLYPKKRIEVEKADATKVADLDAQAADAIYSAAVFRTALGNWQGGIDNYNKFAAAFPADSRTSDVKLTVAKIYEDQGRYTDAANAYAAFYEKPAPNTPVEHIFFARLHHGRTLEAMNQATKAADVYKQSVDLHKKQPTPGDHVAYVAEMMFKLAAPKYEKFDQLTISGCNGCGNKTKEDKAIEASLTAKAASVVDIEKTYVEIIQTGAGEWGLASTVMLGRAYEDMAETLSQSARPYYLTEDQKEMYDMLIVDKVYPQIQKAVEAYQTALTKSYELTLYNDNTAFATRRLGELRPDDFPGLEEELIEARATSASSNDRTFDFERSL
jgi:tetratricopeptide (TPR) repeat protein